MLCFLENTVSGFFCDIYLSVFLSLSLRCRCSVVLLKSKSRDRFLIWFFVYNILFHMWSYILADSAIKHKTKLFETRHGLRVLKPRAVSTLSPPVNCIIVSSNIFNITYNLITFRTDVNIALNRFVWITPASETCFSNLLLPWLRFPIERGTPNLTLIYR